MKRLLIVCVVLGALGAIAWGVGAMVIETAATRWLDDRRDEGWVANTSDVSVNGFPLRYATELHDLDLADPDTGLAWSVASLQIRQDILRLDRVEARWPAVQTVSSPFERLTITDHGMEGSELLAMLDVQPTNRFALDAMRADTGPLLLVSNGGWQTQWEQGSLVVDRVAETEATYDIVALTTSMAPPEAWRARLDPANLLPNIINTARLNATAAFDAPWDMDAIERARPQFTTLEIEDLSLIWGEVTFRATGTLQVTPGGVAEGELAIRAENWPMMMELANNAGIVPERFQGTAEAMLQMLAGLSGRPENIDTTLNFTNGRMLLGGLLPLGPAPSLRLR